MLCVTLWITFSRSFPQNFALAHFSFRYHVTSTAKSGMQSFATRRTKQIEKKFSFGEFMKIGLAMCKCEINLNNYTTTFMFAEMLDTGHNLPFSCFCVCCLFCGTKLVYKYWTTNNIRFFFPFWRYHAGFNDVLESFMLEPHLTVILKLKWTENTHKKKTVQAMTVTYFEPFHCAVMLNTLQQLENFIFNLLMHKP